MAAIANSIFPFLLMLIYLAILIYLVWLAGRFVRAVERIADKIGKSTPTS